MQPLKKGDFSNKRVLLRCDFNVPLDEKGNILDDFRIVQSLPTIEYLIKRKAKVIIIAHLGEPDGQIVESLRLDGVKRRLEELLGLAVIKVDDCIGEEVLEQISRLEGGNVLLLENVRFHKGEMDNDRRFTEQLAALAQVYVNDGFALCHRAHASVVGVPKLLPAFAGLLLEKEVSSLRRILQKPKKPLVVLVGGVKVKTKTKFINNILKTADCVLVNELIQKEIIQQHIRFNHAEKILAPIDSVHSLDIGEDTVNFFSSKILKARTIVWNGPFGKFENQKYKEGTLALARAIIKSKAFTVVGGGETIEFLRKEGMLNKFNHASTGGGAMLNYLAGEELPGLLALK